MHRPRAGLWTALRRRDRSGQAARGSVLIAVLGFTVLMAYLLTAFMEEATSRIRYYGLYANRDDLRAEAYSYLEVTLAVLSEMYEIDDALWDPQQGWDDPLAYAQIEPPADLDVSIRIYDEAAKLSFSTIDEQMLRVFFEEVGLEAVAADDLIDPLLDWVDEDDLERLNGAEAEEYRDLEPPYRPADGPLQSWDELDLIYRYNEYLYDEDGFSTGLKESFQRTFSLYNEGPVNLNAANHNVLEIVEELYGISAQHVQEYRRGPDDIAGTDDDGLINDLTYDRFGVTSAAVSFRSTLFKIEVEVGSGPATFLLTAIVEYVGAENIGAGAERNLDGDEDLENAGLRLHETGEKLGYPFTVYRLSENIRI